MSKSMQKHRELLCIIPMIFRQLPKINIPRATTRDCPYKILLACRGNPLWLPLVYYYLGVDLIWSRPDFPWTALVVLTSATKNVEPRVKAKKKVDLAIAKPTRYLIHPTNDYFALADSMKSQ